MSGSSRTVFSTATITSGELAYAGGLDEDAIRSELLMDLMQSLVGSHPPERAADAAGGHLASARRGSFQRTAVDADLATRFQ